jgi:nucleoside-diphosphate-sugar epimerase
LYIVTGASGWLGRVTLEYLQAECGVDLVQEVRCFSSVEKEIVLRDGTSLKSLPLESISSFSDSVTGVFHFAFLTRDFVAKFGTQKYLEINYSILNILEQYLGAVDFKWVVSVSSGAVFDPGTKTLAANPESNPYGFQKRKEEELLGKIAELKGGTSVIGRLWACTGSDMPIDRKYAMSDFIFQALTEKRIVVDANREIWRRYIDANDFISILHKLAVRGESGVIDSAGSLIELGELAQLIGTFTKANIERPALDVTLLPDKYYPEGLVMSQQAVSLGIRIQPMQEQVERTIKGHIQQLPNYLKESNS